MTCSSRHAGEEGWCAGTRVLGVAVCKHSLAEEEARGFCPVFWKSEAGTEWEGETEAGCLDSTYRVSLKREAGTRHGSGSAPACCPTPGKVSILG